ncbi:MAG: HlyD family efflux transporter periplasmic adaptor subunit [Hespellia sp.]|nr:HlyD family efflux transporter periplasmic adaptor subunit [Hespellia sp.]
MIPKSTDEPVNKSVNIKKYKIKREWNIGIFIFAIVFLYLLVTVILYLTSNKVSVYEVRNGSILKDNSYTGMILRSEAVVPVETDGYINYFVSEASKIKAGANIYTLSPDKVSLDESAEANGVSLSVDKQNSIVLKTQEFNSSYNEDNFSKVYDFKNDLKDTLQSAANNTKTAQLDSLLASAGADSLAVVSSVSDGIIVFETDGYEGVTQDSFTVDELENKKAKVESYTTNRKVRAGDTAYKLITSETWSILFEIDEETAKQLADTTYIKTKLNNDKDSIWADFSIITKEGKQFGCLSYDNSMIRYANDRFVNVELILEDETGLKIPKSSVTEKDFYVVPSEYLTHGGNSSNTGVLRQTTDKNGKTISEFVEAESYATTEDGSVYLDPEQFKEGDVLVMPESTDTFMMKEMSKLKGVYNINKGYTVFKKISILCESDSYYIVETGDSYGLANYDHIVLDANSVKEDEVVFN